MGAVERTCGEGAIKYVGCGKRFTPTAANGIYCESCRRRISAVRSEPRLALSLPPQAAAHDATERRMHLYWAQRECFICTEKAASKRFGPCEHREFEIAAAWAERMAG